MCSRGSDAGAMPRSLAGLAKGCTLPLSGIIWLLSMGWVIIEIGRETGRETCWATGWASDWFGA